MTEQPNTAEIRARLEHHDGVSWLELRNFVVTLTETLDAARAEPALDIAYVDVLLAKIGELSDRLEAAETNAENERLRARIATALAAHRMPEGLPACPCAMCRALTEGTGTDGQT